jgi:threonine aldolase
MREAMISAEVGDDVYGDDPTVNQLQDYAANLLGFESALFTTSGTQANFVALMAHCQRGDEYIVGQHAHTYRYEGGGAAVLGSIQPQPIEFEPDATLDLNKVAAKIKPDDIHFARTRLLCLENTQNGRVLPLEYLENARGFTRANDLKLHLDGARVFNAAVALNVHVSEITHHFDSVSICLSKGLGAPVGSILCGSRNFIETARRWRKVAGGGMRQAGILAAAGLYALNYNVKRLAEDHHNAARLANGLQELGSMLVSFDENQTNMVFLSLAPEDAAPLAKRLKDAGIIITAGEHLRLVTHLNISQEDIDYVLSIFRNYFTHK